LARAGRTYPSTVTGEPQVSVIVEDLSFTELLKRSAENFARFDAASAGRGEWDESDREEEHFLHLTIIAKAIEGDREARAYIDRHWDTKPTNEELKAFLMQQLQQ
jgi:hypothetical protein